jgi:predicted RNA-binding protein
MLAMPAAAWYNQCRGYRERTGRRQVCDLKAYVRNNDGEELVLEAVNNIRIEGGEVVLRSLFGEEKRIRGEVREVSLTKNRVILEQR